jgi:hypothetical protein
MGGSLTLGHLELLRKSRLAEGAELQIGTWADIPFLRGSIQEGKKVSTFVGVVPSGEVSHSLLSGGFNNDFARWRMRNLSRAP